MSEFEFIDAYQSGIELIAMAAMDFATLFFAYVVAVYLVGKSIGKPIAIAMSAIYSFFLVGPFVAIVSTQVSLNNLVSQVVLQYPDSAYFSGYSPGLAFSLLISLIPALTAWFSSLFYMHGYVRGGFHGP